MYAEPSETFSNALACCSRASLIVSGTRPVDAGPKNACAAPNTAEVTTNIQISIASVSNATATTAWTAARIPSQASITSRRGSRSAQTPPTTMKLARASVNAARTRPSSAAPPPVWSTANGSATKITESPMAEAVCPSHNSRNCRSWSAPSLLTSRR